MTALEIATRAVRLYAESHPRPPHVTQAQAGEMLRLSDRPCAAWSAPARCVLTRPGESRSAKWIG